MSSDEELDPQRLREITEQMLRAMTSPEFVEQLQAVRNARGDRQLAEASQRLTPEALREAGVDLPDGMRISSRYFEEDYDFPIELGDIGDGPNIVNALNEAQPGLLDDLKDEHPEAFRKIVTVDSDGVMPTGEPGVLAGCCGGGGATVCGCCGGDAMGLRR